MPGSSAGPANQPSGGEGTRKALRILASFTEDRPRLAITDLASDLEIPSSTAYRYVALLKEAGLVEEGQPGLYQIGRGAFQLARAAQAVNELAAIARPILVEIRDQLDENVTVLRTIGDSAVCIDRVESSRAMRISFHPGQSLPLGMGASGKALLSTRTAEERRALLERRAVAEPALRPGVEGLLRELAEVRRTGCAESLSEINDGVWAFSVVVHGYRQGAVALSVAAPAFRLTAAQQDLARRLVVAGARTLELSLVGRPT
jgi:DNA-binding IclR family transcriptional regulator